MITNNIHFNQYDVPQEIIKLVYLAKKKINFLQKVFGV